MKVIIHFISDNGYIPYATYGSASFKFCLEFGPNLYPVWIGGVNPIFPLPEKIGTDLTLDKLFDILDYKSVRVEFRSPHDIYLTVPGYKEDWVVCSKMK